MSEITDLAKTIKEENEKTRALNEKLANGTRENGQFASKEEIDVAKASLKKQDDQRAMTKKMLGISERRMAKAEELTNQIQAQEQIMAEQKSALEESGIDADKSAKYQKEQIKLDKLNAQKDNATGAAASEDDAKAAAKDSKMMGYLQQTAGFLGGIAKQGMQKVKSGLGGLSKFLMGGLAVAALAFLNHPKFKEMIALLSETIIPLLATFYDEVLVPIGESLAKLFGDIMLVLKGEKSLMSVLMDNKLAILGIITALAPNLVFGALKLAVMGIGKALLWASAKSGLTALIMKGLKAIKLGFIAMKTSVLGFMTPLLPIIAIAAGIALVLYSLKKSFDDFMFELEATGSVWEAIKTAFVSFFANGLGIILNPIKDGISWVIGKIGSIFGIESFTNAAKAMDDFDFVEGITELMTFVGEYFSGLWQRVKDGIQEFLRSSRVGSFAADKIFGTPEEQVVAKKAKEEEQKLFEENRKALREQQKLEKAEIEKKKVEKIKAEQKALQPKALTAPALTPMSASGQPASNIVNAPTSVVNAPSSSNTSVSTPLRQPNAVIGQLASAA